jgi:acetoacetyl-CoA synthetase
MYAFSLVAGAAAGEDLTSYPSLHRWSISHPEDFWRLWLGRSGIATLGSDDPVHDGGPFHRRKWFPHLRLSAAANLMRGSTEEDRADEEALVAFSEDGSVRRITWSGLFDHVMALREELAPLLAPGDRVAAVLPNGVEAVIAMLASVSLGAVWSSASPDFGVDAILDRFRQIDPVVFFGCRGYSYGGKWFDAEDRMETVRSELPSLRAGYVPFEVPRDRDRGGQTSPCDRQRSLDALPKFAFDHPMYTMFSSGTTGTPKCIVHGVGGTLLQHAKEHILHSDIRPGDRVFYFTTCGWMMWNWLVSALFTRATVILYDGSPMYPGPTRLWDLAGTEGITHFGTSPRFLAACRSARVRAVDQTRTVRTIFSTGAPLLPEDFDYVYESIAPKAQLASISGGTDIISCFILGVPTLPVRRGEIQAAGLGMDVAAVGESVDQPLIGQRGELVCRTPFPSRPIGFHGDDDEQSRYRAAYFDRFPGVWTHGDLIEITGSVDACGGVIVYGRSDATLNPGGVRIGTAEIYRQVETMPEIADSLVVGRPLRGDVEVVLFVQRADGRVDLDDDLSRRIREKIRTNASPRHVPRRIFFVSGIPYTRSGKKVELAVRDVLSGITPANLDAIANAEVLEEYRAVAAGLS